MMDGYGWIVFISRGQAELDPHIQDRGTYAGIVTIIIAGRRAGQ
jgi:hypothetical protein